MNIFIIFIDMDVWRAKKINKTQFEYTLVITLDSFDWYIRHHYDESVRLVQKSRI